MPPRFESVHLPDFDGPAGAVPPQIARRARFYGDLARFGSITPSGHARQTPIACRRRPRRQRCPGLLVVRRRDVPEVVDWQCPECATHGVISGWTDTDADLRTVELAPDRAISVVAVPLDVHAALRDAARHEASLIPLAYGAAIDGTGALVLSVQPEDGFRLASKLAQTALMTKPRRDGERLLELAEVLASILAETGPEEHLAGIDAGAWAEVVAEMFGVGGSAETGHDGAEPESTGRASRERPKRSRDRRRSSQTFRIKVSLRHIKPPVWRRLLVPSDIRLPLLHDVLQAAMGWHDCHLHAFRVGDQEWAPPSDFEAIGEDSSEVSLEQIAPGKGSRVLYEYDFGDGWQHEIVVEAVVDERCSAARCVTGRRNCPPEDCGGPYGYADFVAVITDPSHPRHAEFCAWANPDFDPESFDVDAIDARLRQIPV